MSALEEKIKELSSKDKRLIRKSEKDFLKLMDTVYLTVEGKITIPQLIREFGEPVIVKKYAEIEAKTGSTRVATIVVERFVDAVLKFNDQIVIQNVPQGLLLDIPHSGIVIEWIRHPTYNHENLPKATKAEIRKSQIQI